MPIQDKIKSNPELIQANTLVANALNDLLERRWGTVTIVFSAQNGKIATVKIIDDKIYKMNPPPILEKD